MAAPISLRGRLLRILLPATLVTLLFSGALMVKLVEQQSWREFDRSLYLDAEDLASRILIEDGEILLDDEELDLPLPDHYLLRDGTGEVLLGAGELEQEDRATPLRSIRYSFDPRIDPSDEEEAQELPPRFGPPLELQVGADPSSQHAFLRTLWWTMAGSGLILLMVIALVTWLGVRLGLRPLGLFRQRIQQLNEHDLAWASSPSPVPLELVPVEQELAHLIERLREAIARERRFIDAAAHELRTPLAELRTVSEVSLRLPHSVEATHTLEQCREIGLEMEEMVELLLQLSRAPQELAQSPHDGLLQSALLTHVRMFEPEILRKNLNLEANWSSGCPWQMPVRAAQLVARNLLANAVEYTGEGGSISLQWQQQGGHGILRIQNGPVSLQDQDLLHLSEPFWRKDPARSDRRHHGLGLALVDAVARACRLKRSFARKGKHLEVTLSGVISGS